MCRGCVCELKGKDEAGTHTYIAYDAITVVERNMERGSAAPLDGAFEFRVPAKASNLLPGTECWSVYIDHWYTNPATKGKASCRSAAEEAAREHRQLCAPFS